MIAVLLDPDKCTEKMLDELASQSGFEEVDLLLVGGSTVNDGDMERCLEAIQRYTDKPRVIFPGGSNQISSKADAFLLLSLISGRNPDLLIGKHVEAAFELSRSGLEVIPTSYILLDGGKQTAVATVSKTVPMSQIDIKGVCATALAGKQLGHKLTYLDCGSGAHVTANPALVKELKSVLDAPLIIGGGISDVVTADGLFAAGADMIVVGNKLEQDPAFLRQLVESKHRAMLSSVQQQ